MLRITTVAAVLAGLVALLFSWYTAHDDEFSFQPIQGKNNTVLFITDQHPGFCNVHLATVYSLLENHPEVEIHFASFTKNAGRLKRISALAAQRGATSCEVKFHLLDGLGYVDAIDRAIGGQTGSVHAPGLAGAGHLAKNMNYYLAPWSAEEYEILYLSLINIIDEVDPAVVVVDTFFSPGIDATRNRRRLHALVTPNLLTHTMPAAQPLWTQFWKYPAVGLGFPYPVPWSLIPSNIYASFQMIRGLLNLPELSAKKRILRDKGIKRPIDFLGLYRPNVPWLTQTLPGAHIPMAVMPANVTLTGPINLAGLEEKDDAAQALLDWVDKRTIMISLGSGFAYTEHRARTMLGAIRNILNETDMQVLWKMDKLTSFGDHFIETAVQESSGRLKIEKWLAVEPPTLAQNENIVAFVHHGGAGCFHDSLGAGTPQVILPLWGDLYDNAQLAESLGIGIWACRETSPEWTSACIQRAVLLAVNDSDTRAMMAEKLASFAEVARKTIGRDVASREVAKLAASGHS